MKCLFGKSLRLALFLPFVACTELAQQLEESRVLLAVDNYYVSSLFLLCLAHHTVLGPRIAKSNKIGVPGALEFWEKDKITIENKGDSRFARTMELGRELAVLHFRDYNDVFLVSNVHILKKGLEDLPYRGAQRETRPILIVPPESTPPVAVK